jgi:methionyl-tRNA formyltransferase
MSEASRRLRVYVCGQKEFGARVLRLAVSLGHDVVGCCCPLANTRGDGPDRAREAADTFGIPCIPSGTLSADSLPDGVDVIVAAHSHDFIGQRTRYRARYGAVGYHPSLLPRHRGRDAIRWALRMKDPVIGGTVYWLNEVMDGGPIAAQDWCWLYDGDTPQDVWRDRLFPMGVRLLGEVLADVPRFFAGKHPQDERAATFEPAMNPPRAYRPDLLGLPAPR